MKTEFTPGPWPLETVKTSCGICHKVGVFPKTDGRTNSACVYVDYNAHAAEMLANANLIAAAPDLYAALEDMIDAHDSRTEDSDAKIEARQAALTALAKARGEHL